MRKTIFWKLFGTYVLVILALSVLVLVFTFARIRTHYEDTLAGELESLGRVLNRSIGPRLEAAADQGLDAFVKEMGQEIHARITVLDLEGRVLADSDADPATMENHRYRPEVTEALEGKIGRSRRFSYTVEQNMLYVGLPIVAQGRTAGILRLSYLMKTIDDLHGRLRSTIARIVLIGALAALGLAFFVSLRIARPIGRLTRAARAIADGHFDTRVALGHREEFRDLGDAFDSMTERIRELFTQVTRRTDELESIVSSLREGIIVADAEGRIVLANRAIKGILGDDRPEGRFVWEVVRSPKVQAFIDRARAAAAPIEAEIGFGARTYRCTGLSMPHGGRILLALSEAPLDQAGNGL